LSIAYGVYAIIMALAGSAVNFIYLAQPMLAEAHGKSGPEATAALAGAIGSVAGGCFGLLYPVLLIIFMTRKNVKAAFEPVGG